MRTLKTYVSCYIFVGILIYVISACVRFKVKQSNTTQRSLYERVKRGMGLGGEGGKRLEERGHSANHESVLGVGEGRHHINGRGSQMYVFFLQRKSIISY